jgi:hypothetical protein
VDILELDALGHAVALELLGNRSRPFKIAWASSTAMIP